MENKLSYFRGCLLGLAVGDAMGYTVDKKTWEEIERDYGPNGLLGYDLVNGCADVTSYTQLAAFVCNGLLLGAFRAQPDALNKYIALALREWVKSQQPRINAERSRCWVAQVSEMRRRHCMDTRMLDTLTRQNLGTPEKPENGFTSPAGLTAAVAVGLFFDPKRMEPAQVGRLGAEAVAMMQGDVEAFLSGAVLAYCIAGILQEPEHTLAEQVLHATAAVCAQFAEQFAQVYDIQAQVEKAMALTRDSELTPLAAMTLLGCTTASECLAGAVYASIIHAGNFDEGMIAAVNHSGRSAAVGAMTGALLGAKLGAEALPEFYLESLEVTGVLDTLAEDLAIGCRTAKIFDDSWDQKYIQGMPV